MGKTNHHFVVLLLVIFKKHFIYETVLFIAFESCFNILLLK